MEGIEKDMNGYFVPCMRGSVRDNSVPHNRGSGVICHSSVGNDVTHLTIPPCLVWQPLKCPREGLRSVTSGVWVTCLASLQCGPKHHQVGVGSPSRPLNCSRYTLNSPEVRRSICLSDAAERQDIPGQEPLPRQALLTFLPGPLTLSCQ
ncbi:hypothetical protein DPEC_G00336130 [Dallia pectoralis]|uniref:Uncharacterized protein n=1 Tax=Dallia pectoralis TaxID=75939 RepID=A0ACC2F7D3_DALPE|nr:hypothetical protein DPEC_G00336130 [Dallia pectoralis]